MRLLPMTIENAVSPSSFPQKWESMGSENSHYRWIPAYARMTSFINMFYIFISFENIYDL